MMAHIEYAREWLGTPFHIKGALKGVGVDCCHVVFDSLARAGVIKPIVMPCYKLDGISDPGQLVYPMLLNSVIAPYALPVVEDIQAGDLLIYRFDNRVRHIAIATTPDRHLHTSVRFGVMENQITDGFKQKLFKIHRVVCHG